MGINCEATNLKTVDIVHKGIYQCDITIYGKAIHGSRPWLGVNAIDKAVKVLNRIKILGEQLKLRKNNYAHYPTINVGTIQGGTVVNMIPSQCKLEINRRIIPGESFEMAEKEIQAILDQLSKEDPDFRAELKSKNINLPILDVPSDAPVVKSIQKAHKFQLEEKMQEPMHLGL
ncbi:Acetylornithine deacetylase [subsurface metagenome]